MLDNHRGLVETVGDFDLTTATMLTNYDALGSAGHLTLSTPNLFNTEGGLIFSGDDMTLAVDRLVNSRADSTVWVTSP